MLPTSVPDDAVDVVGFPHEPGGRLRWGGGQASPPTAGAPPPGPPGRRRRPASTPTRRPTTG